ncbi:MAG: hypothetical protein HDS68_10425 [Bacteroidales bacterium]|nr:hypothetical protein [Bacteroidales bacterium]
MKSITIWIMVLTCAFTVAAVWFIPTLYRQVVDKSNVSIRVDMSGVVFTSEQPMWFRVDSTEISTNKALEIGDIKELRSLVSDTCSTYPMYVNAIGKLAYQSNNDTTNLNYLILLTLSFVLLGCSARTLYDFIGRRCYKKEQDMSVWWPWYVFRPIICAPIAALLLVSVRTSFFSNLFVAKDLNSYLVVSFIAGFAIMEFLTMLRRLSKSLFDASGFDSKNDSKKDNAPKATTGTDNKASAGK